ncbi:hypothetical protein LZ31DRAFT_596008 [Colletotrichum somersetense]|nr:hypothetical protein LZ31DRAFT_596008 [Colletotrichum somersetense]
MAEALEELDNLRTAAALLMEPRLGPFHQTDLHLLVSTSDNDYVHHAKEAVRLYTEVMNENDLIAIDQEVQMEFASGKTMTDLHHTQMQDLLDREHLAQELADANRAASGGPVGSSQDVPGDAASQTRVLIPSSNPQTSAAESQRNNVGQSQ